MGSSPSSRQGIDRSPLQGQTQTCKGAPTQAATSKQLSNLGCMAGLAWCRRLTLHPLAPTTAPLLGLAANTLRAPASQSSHACVGENPLHENTWKPRREEGISHKCRVLLQAAACGAVPSGCRQGAGRAVHAGARPPWGRAPNSAICFPFRSDRAETDFIELLSNS